MNAFNTCKVCGDTTLTSFSVCSHCKAWFGLTLSDLLPEDSRKFAKSIAEQADQLERGEEVPVLRAAILRSRLYKLLFCWVPGSLSMT